MLIRLVSEKYNSTYCEIEKIGSKNAIRLEMVIHKEMIDYMENDSKYSKKLFDNVYSVFTVPTQNFYAHERDIYFIIGGIYTIMDEVNIFTNPDEREYRMAQKYADEYTKRYKLSINARLQNSDIMNTNYFSYYYIGILYQTYIELKLNMIKLIEAED